MSVRPIDSLAGLVQSLHQVLERAAAPGATPSVDALRQQAKAAGLDAEMAVEVLARVTQQPDPRRHRELIQKSATQEEIAEAVLGLLRDGSLRRPGAWAEARTAVRDSGAQLATVMESLLAVVDHTGFGLRPNLSDLGQELSASLRQAADVGRMAPWQTSLRKAWLQSDRGRAGHLPDHNDLADLLAEPALVRALTSAADGPWDALTKQATWVRAHRHVGAALDQLHAAS